MIVTAPDGRQFNIPTNDPNVARQTVRQRLAQEWIVKNQSGKPGKTTGMDKAIAALTSGATLGASDVVGGLAVQGAAAAKNAWDKFQGRTPTFDSIDAYRAAREVQKEKAAGSPILNNVFGLLGGLKAPFVNEAGKFVAGETASVGKGLLDQVLGSKSVPLTAARGAVAATPYGAVTGATYAAPGHELEGAKRGATVAAAIGGAIPLGAAGLGPVARTGGNIVSTIARAGAKGAGITLDAPSATAARELAAALRADKATPDQLRQIQNEWLKTGASTPSLMDLASKLPGGGINTLRLMTGAAMRGGGATEYADTVATNLPENAANLVRKLAPNGTSAAKTAIALKATQRQQAADLYPEAYQTPVTLGPDARSALQDEHGVAAINQAIKAATSKRDYESAARLRALLPGAQPPQAPPSLAPPSAPGEPPEPMNTPPPFTPPPVRGQDAIRAEQDAAGLAQAHRDIGAYAEPPTNSLFARIQKAGGISLKDDTFDLKDGVGDLIKQKRLPVGMFNENSPYDTLGMAEHLGTQGMFGGSEKPPIEDFLAAFDKESRGTKVYHPDAVSPDWDQRNQAIEQELSDAGIPAAMPAKVKAQKLFEARNADTVEQRAVQDEANANDPAGLEFDRLAASQPSSGVPVPPPVQPTAPPILAKDLDRIQISMGKLGRAATDANQSDVGAGLFDRQRSLNDILSNVPELGPARANYKANMARLDALKLGKQGLTLPADEYGEQMEDLQGAATPDDNAHPISAQDIQDAAKVGYVKRAVNSIQRPAAGGTGTINVLAKSPAQIANQDATFGADAGDMRAGLGNELTRVRNARLIDPTLNARTAGRLDALAGLEVPKLTPSGLVLGAINKIRQSAALTPEEFDAIVSHGVGTGDHADILSALDPDNLHPIMNSINDTAKRYGVVGADWAANPANQTGQ